MIIDPVITDAGVAVVVVLVKGGGLCSLQSTGKISVQFTMLPGLLIATSR